MAKKRGFLTLVLALVMAIGLTVPTWAEEGGNTAGATHKVFIYVEAKIDFVGTNNKVTGKSVNEIYSSGGKSVEGVVTVGEDGSYTFDSAIESAIGAIDAEVAAKYSSYTVQSKENTAITFTAGREGGATVNDMLSLYRTYTVNTGNKIVSVELDNVTLNFKAGDAPKFTATMPENAPYTLDEVYWEDFNSSNSYKGVCSAHPNNFGTKELTAFTYGKPYTYQAIVKASEDFTFAQDCKFYLNGELISNSSTVYPYVNTYGGTDAYYYLDVTIEQSQSAPRYYYNSTTTTTGTDAPQGSPKTFDPGVAVYALSGLLSLGGLTAVAKKRGR